MKRILNASLMLLALLFSSACTGNTPEKEETRKVIIYNDDYIKLFDEDYAKKILDVDSNIGDDVLKIAGTKLPNYTFKDLNGNDIELGDGPYVLEIVGYWCDYCKLLSEKIMNELILKYPDIKFYQYFIDSSPEDVKSFYKDISKDIPEGLTVLVSNNDEFDEWLFNSGFNGVPLIIPVTEEGTISIIKIGYENYDYFIKLIDFSIKENIGEYKLSNGQTFSSFTQEQAVAKRYIEELTEIDIPAEYFD